MKTMPFDSDEF